MALYHKDPDAVWDFNIDWATNWMVTDDTVSTSTWTVPAGITKDSDTFTAAGVTTVWLSGGGAVDTIHKLENRITTAGGRTEDQTIHVKMREN